MSNKIMELREQLVVQRRQYRRATDPDVKNMWQRSVEATVHELSKAILAGAR